jgi:hypothetical protein
MCDVNGETVSQILNALATARRSRLRILTQLGHHPASRRGVNFGRIDNPPLQIDTSNADEVFDEHALDDDGDVSKLCKRLSWEDPWCLLRKWCRRLEFGEESICAQTDLETFWPDFFTPADIRKLKQNPHKVLSEGLGYLRYAILLFSGTRRFKQASDLLQTTFERTPLLVEKLVSVCGFGRLDADETELFGIMRQRIEEAMNETWKQGGAKDVMRAFVADARKALSVLSHECRSGRREFKSDEEVIDPSGHTLRVVRAEEGIVQVNRYSKAEIKRMKSNVEELGMRVVLVPDRDSKASPSRTDGQANDDTDAVTEKAVVEFLKKKLLLRRRGFVVEALPRECYAVQSPPSNVGIDVVTELKCSSQTTETIETISEHRDRMWIKMDDGRLILSEKKHVRRDMIPSSELTPSKRPFDAADVGGRVIVTDTPRRRAATVGAFMNYVRERIQLDRERTQKTKLSKEELQSLQSRDGIWGEQMLRATRSNPRNYRWRMIKFLNLEIFVGRCLGTKVKVNTETESQEEEEVLISRKEMELFPIIDSHAWMKPHGCTKTVLVTSKNFIRNMKIAVNAISIDVSPFMSLEVDVIDASSMTQPLTASFLEKHRLLGQRGFICAPLKDCRSEWHVAENDVMKVTKTPFIDLRPETDTGDMLRYRHNLSKLSSAWMRLDDGRLLIVPPTFLRVLTPTHESLSEDKVFATFSIWVLSNMPRNFFVEDDSGTKLSLASETALLHLAVRVWQQSWYVRYRMGMERDTQIAEIGSDGSLWWLLNLLKEVMQSYSSQHRDSQLQLSRKSQELDLSRSPVALSIFQKFMSDLSEDSEERVESAFKILRAARRVRRRLLQDQDLIWSAQHLDNISSLIRTFYGAPASGGSTQIKSTEQTISQSVSVPNAQEILSWERKVRYNLAWLGMNKGEKKSAYRYAEITFDEDKDPQYITFMEVMKICQQRRRVVNDLNSCWFSDEQPTNEGFWTVIGQWRTVEDTTLVHKDVLTEMRNFGAWLRHECRDVPGESEERHAFRKRLKNALEDFKLPVRRMRIKPGDGPEYDKTSDAMIEIRLEDAATLDADVDRYLQQMLSGHLRMSGDVEAERVACTFGLLLRGQLRVTLTLDLEGDEEPHVSFSAASRWKTLQPYDQLPIVDSSFGLSYQIPELNGIDYRELLRALRTLDMFRRSPDFLALYLPSPLNRSVSQLNAVLRHLDDHNGEHATALGVLQEASWQLMETARRLREINAQNLTDEMVTTAEGIESLVKTSMFRETSGDALVPGNRTRPPQKFMEAQKIIDRIGDLVDSASFKMLREARGKLESRLTDSWSKKIETIQDGFFDAASPESTAFSERVKMLVDDLVKEPDETSVWTLPSKAELENRVYKMVAENYVTFVRKAHVAALLKRNATVPKELIELTATLETELLLGDLVGRQDDAIDDHGVGEPVDKLATFWTELQQRLSYEGVFKTLLKSTPGIDLQTSDELAKKFAEAMDSVQTVDLAKKIAVEIKNSDVPALRDHLNDYAKLAELKLENETNNELQQKKISELEQRIEDREMNNWLKTSIAEQWKRIVDGESFKSEWENSAMQLSEFVQTKVFQPLLNEIEEHDIHFLDDIEIQALRSHLRDLAKLTELKLENELRQKKISELEQRIQVRRLKFWLKTSIAEKWESIVYGKSFESDWKNSKMKLSEFVQTEVFQPLLNEILQTVRRRMTETINNSRNTTNPDAAASEQVWHILVYLETATWLEEILRFEGPQKAGSVCRSFRNKLANYLSGPSNFRQLRNKVLEIVDSFEDDKTRTHISERLPEILVHLDNRVSDVAEILTRLENKNPKIMEIVVKDEAKTYIIERLPQILVHIDDDLEVKKTIRRWNTDDTGNLEDDSEMEKTARLEKSRRWLEEWLFASKGKKAISKPSSNSDITRGRNFVEFVSDKFNDTLGQVLGRRVSGGEAIAAIFSQHLALNGGEISEKLHRLFNSLREMGDKQVLGYEHLDFRLLSYRSSGPLASEFKHVTADLTEYLYCRYMARSLTLVSETFKDNAKLKPESLMVASALSLDRDSLSIFEADGSEWRCWWNFGTTRLAPCPSMIEGEAQWVLEQNLERLSRPEGSDERVSPQTMTGKIIKVMPPLKAIPNDPLKKRCEELLFWLRPMPHNLKERVDIFREFLRAFSRTRPLTDSTDSDLHKLWRRWLEILAAVAHPLPLPAPALPSSPWSIRIETTNHTLARGSDGAYVVSPPLIKYVTRHDVMPPWPGQSDLDNSGGGYEIIVPQEIPERADAATKTHQTTAHELGSKIANAAAMFDETWYGEKSQTKLAESQTKHANLPCLPLPDEDHVEILCRTTLESLKIAPHESVAFFEAWARELSVQFKRLVRQRSVVQDVTVALDDTERVSLARPNFVPMQTRATAVAQDVLDAIPLALKSLTLEEFGCLKVVADKQTPTPIDVSEYSQQMRQAILESVSEIWKKEEGEAVDDVYRIFICLVSVAARPFNCDSHHRSVEKLAYYVDFPAFLQHGESHDHIQRKTTSSNEKGQTQEKVRQKGDKVISRWRQFSQREEENKRKEEKKRKDIKKREERREEEGKNDQTQRKDEEEKSDENNDTKPVVAVSGEDVCKWYRMSTHDKVPALIRSYLNKRRGDQMKTESNRARSFGDENFLRPLCQTLALSELWRATNKKFAKPSDGGGGPRRHRVVRVRMTVFDPSAKTLDMKAFFPDLHNQLQSEVARILLNTSTDGQEIASQAERNLRNQEIASQVEEWLWSHLEAKLLNSTVMTLGSGQGQFRPQGVWNRFREWVKVDVTGSAAQVRMMVFDSSAKTFDMKAFYPDLHDQLQSAVDCNLDFISADGKQIASWMEEWLWPRLEANLSISDVMMLRSGRENFRPHVDDWKRFPDWVKVDVTRSAAEEWINLGSDVLAALAEKFESLYGGDDAFVLNPWTLDSETGTLNVGPREIAKHVTMGTDTDADETWRDTFLMSTRSKIYRDMQTLSSSSDETKQMRQTELVEQLSIALAREGIEAPIHVSEKSVKAVIEQVVKPETMEVVIRFLTFVSLKEKLAEGVEQEQRHDYVVQNDESAIFMFDFISKIGGIESRKLNLWLRKATEVVPRTNLSTELRNQISNRQKILLQFMPTQNISVDIWTLDVLMMLTETSLLCSLLTHELHGEGDELEREILREQSISSQIMPALSRQSAGTLKVTMSLCATKRSKTDFARSGDGLSYSNVYVLMKDERLTTALADRLREKMRSLVDALMVIKNRGTDEVMDHIARHSSHLLERMKLLERNKLHESLMRNNGEDARKMKIDLFGTNTFRCAENFRGTWRDLDELVQFCSGFVVLDPEFGRICTSVSDLFENSYIELRATINNAQLNAQTNAQSGKIQISFRLNNELIQETVLKQRIQEIRNKASKLHFDATTLEQRMNLSPSIEFRPSRSTGSMGGLKDAARAEIKRHLILQRRHLRRTLGEIAAAFDSSDDRLRQGYDELASRLAEWKRLLGSPNSFEEWRKLKKESPETKRSQIENLKKEDGVMYWCKELKRWISGTFVSRNERKLVVRNNVGREITVTESKVELEKVRRMMLDDAAQRSLNESSESFDEWRKLTGESPETKTGQIENLKEKDKVRYWCEELKRWVSGNFVRLNERELVVLNDVEREILVTESKVELEEVWRTMLVEIGTSFQRPVSFSRGGLPELIVIADLLAAALDDLIFDPDGDATRSQHRPVHLLSCIVASLVGPKPSGVIGRLHLELLIYMWSVNKKTDAENEELRAVLSRLLQWTVRLIELRTRNPENAVASSDNRVGQHVGASGEAAASGNVKTWKDRAQTFCNRLVSPPDVALTTSPLDIIKSLSNLVQKSYGADRHLLLLAVAHMLNSVALEQAKDVREGEIEALLLKKDLWVPLLLNYNERMKSASWQKREGHLICSETLKIEDCLPFVRVQESPNAENLEKVREILTKRQELREVLDSISSLSEQKYLSLEELSTSRSTFDQNDRYVSYFWWQFKSLTETLAPSVFKNIYWIASSWTLSGEADDMGAEKFTDDQLIAIAAIKSGLGLCKEAKRSLLNEILRNGGTDEDAATLPPALRYPDHETSPLSPKLRILLHSFTLAAYLRPPIDSKVTGHARFLQSVLQLPHMASDEEATSIAPLSENGDIDSSSESWKRALTEVAPSQRREADTEFSGQLGRRTFLDLNRRSDFERGLRSLGSTAPWVSDSEAVVEQLIRNHVSGTASDVRTLLKDRRAPLARLDHLIFTEELVTATSSKDAARSSLVWQIPPIELLVKIVQATSANDDPQIPECLRSCHDKRQLLLIAVHLAPLLLTRPFVNTLREPMFLGERPEKIQIYLNSQKNARNSNIDCEMQSILVRRILRRSRASTLALMNPNRRRPPGASVSGVAEPTDVLRCLPDRRPEVELVVRAEAELGAFVSALEKGHFGATLTYVPSKTTDQDELMRTIDTQFADLSREILRWLRGQERDGTGDGMPFMILARANAALRYVMLRAERDNELKDKERELIRSFAKFQVKSRFEAGLWDKYDRTKWTGLRKLALMTLEEIYQWIEISEKNLKSARVKVRDHLLPNVNDEIRVKQVSEEITNLLAASKRDRRTWLAYIDSIADIESVPGFDYVVKTDDPHASMQTRLAKYLKESLRTSAQLDYRTIGIFQGYIAAVKKIFVDADSQLSKDEENIELCLKHAKTPKTNEIDKAGNRTRTGVEEIQNILKKFDTRENEDLKSADSNAAPFCNKFAFFWSRFQRSFKKTLRGDENSSQYFMTAMTERQYLNLEKKAREERGRSWMRNTAVNTHSGDKGLAAMKSSILEDALPAPLSKMPKLDIMEFLKIDEEVEKMMHLLEEDDARTTLKTAATDYRANTFLRSAFETVSTRLSSVVTQLEEAVDAADYEVVWRCCCERESVFFHHSLSREERLHHVLELLRRGPAPCELPSSARERLLLVTSTSGQSENVKGWMEFSSAATETVNGILNDLRRSAVERLRRLACLCHRRLGGEGEAARTDPSTSPDHSDDIEYVAVKFVDRLRTLYDALKHPTERRLRIDENGALEGGISSLWGRWRQALLFQVEEAREEALWASRRVQQRREEIDANVRKISPLQTRGICFLKPIETKRESDFQRARKLEEAATLRWAERLTDVRSYLDTFRKLLDKSREVLSKSRDERNWLRVVSEKLSKLESHIQTQQIALTRRLRLRDGKVVLESSYKSNMSLEVLQSTLAEARKRPVTVDVPMPETWGALQWGHLLKQEREAREEFMRKALPRKPETMVDVDELRRIWADCATTSRESYGMVSREAGCLAGVLRPSDERRCADILARLETETFITQSKRGHFRLLGLSPWIPARALRPLLLRGADPKVAERVTKMLEGVDTHDLELTLRALAARKIS